MYLLKSLSLTIALAAAAANASDSGLSVSTSAKVVASGQSTEVSVFAHFPETAHAFAQSTFGVAASTPAWSSVSGGVIAGPTVQGIIAGQSHNPFVGVFADPSNPIKVWQGTYTAKTKTPLLVPITATPATFSYYPSLLTSSAVSTEAKAGTTWLFVNPLTVSGVAIAPRQGASIGFGVSGRDLLVGGDGHDQSILIGMLCPAVQNVRVNPSAPPAWLTFGTHYEGIESSAAVTFTATVTPDMYHVQPEWPLADEYEYNIEYRGQTVRLRFAATNNRGMLISQLPKAYASVPSHDPVHLDDLNNWRQVFGNSTPIIDPEGRPMLADSIEIRAIRHNSPGGLTATVQTIEVGGAHGTGGGGGAGKCAFQDLHF